MVEATLRIFENLACGTADVRRAVVGAGALLELKRIMKTGAWANAAIATRALANLVETRADVITAIVDDDFLAILVEVLKADSVDAIASAIYCVCSLSTGTASVKEALAVSGVLKEVVKALSRLSESETRADSRFAVGPHCQTVVPPMLMLLLRSGDGKVATACADILSELAADHSHALAQSMLTPRTLRELACLVGSENVSPVADLGIATLLGMIVETRPSEHHTFVSDGMLNGFQRLLQSDCSARKTIAATAIWHLLEGPAAIDSALMESDAIARLVGMMASRADKEVISACKCLKLLADINDDAKYVTIRADGLPTALHAVCRCTGEAAVFASNVVSRLCIGSLRL